MVGVLLALQRHNLRTTPNGGYVKGSKVFGGCRQITAPWLVARGRFDCCDVSHASRQRRNHHVHRRPSVTATGGDLLVGDPRLGDCKQPQDGGGGADFADSCLKSRDCCLNKLRRLREGWRWQTFIIHGRFPAMLLGPRGNNLYFDARNLWPDAIGESSCRPTHHSDFDDTAYDLRSQAIRARLYACLLGPQDKASERLLALADDLETRADAAERASIAPCLMLA